MLSTLTRLVAKATNPHAEVSDQARRSLNSIPFEESENYILFSTKYDLHSVTIDGDCWQFYDTGPGRLSAPKVPLILIPGTTGTADVFFQQLLTLGLRGYRLISVTIPNASTVDHFIKSLNRLLSYLDVDHFHLLGTSLGGYLSLSFAAKYPSRVLSLILTNSFISTRLFHDNAPYIPSEMMPEFYLRRYITAALPTHRQQSIQMALATDFVLKQVNSLDRNQLASRLSLNFSKHSIERIEYPQECITIIDTLDTAALDPGMRDSLYALLHGARYSTMKYGGDFPYLANYMEYTMLIQVHLRRHCALIEYGAMHDERPRNEEQQCTRHLVRNPEQMINATKRDVVSSTNRGGDQSSDLPTHFGCFDHRRQYHDAQKAAIFRDDDQKDGVYYGSEQSSMSSDGFDHHTEDDKRKSLLYSKGMIMEEHKDGYSGDTPRIMGIDGGMQSQSRSHSRSHHEYSSEEIANGGSYGYHRDTDDGDGYGDGEVMVRSEHLDPFVIGGHTEDYTITKEKTRRYLQDKRIKKKRYKEYLIRKKKAHKKRVALRRQRELREQKESGDAADDEMTDLDATATANVANSKRRKTSLKKKRRRKHQSHRSKRKRKARGRSRSRRSGKSSGTQRRHRKRSNDRYHRDSEDGHKGKEYLRKQYEMKKMRLEMRQNIIDSMMSVQRKEQSNAVQPLPGSRGRKRTVESADASGYRPDNRADSGMNLAAMGFGADDLQRIRSTSTNSMVSPVSVNTPLSLRGARESQQSLIDEESADNDKIVEVGNDLISPKHSAVSNTSDVIEEEEHRMTKLPLVGSHLSNLSKPQHRAPSQNRSILEMLEMHPIVEESSIATQQDPKSKVNLLDYTIDIEDDDDEEVLGDDDGDIDDREEARRVHVNSKVMDREDRDHQDLSHKSRQHRASSRHRTVRESRRHRGMSSLDDDKDQTPMELAVSQSQHNKKPTTLGGHRYIPSYDSQMSEQALTLDFSEIGSQSRPRSSSYRPWNGNDRGRNHSYMSDLGNVDEINYEMSEIQDWPMEGTENALDHLNLAPDTPSNQPMIVMQRYRDDSVTPRAMNSLMPPSHHVVMESDDHVGDSIF